MIEKIQNLLTDQLLPFLIKNSVGIVSILVVAYAFTILAKFLIEKAVRKFIKSGVGVSVAAEKKREDTLISILTGTSKIVIWILAILVALSEVGVDIGPLIAGAGIVGIAVGFGGQYLVRDLVTGIFILLENQYRVGDVVRINNETAGKVEVISLRLTVLRDLDGIVHHIPHGEVKIVSNLSKGFSKVNINFGVSYEDDVDAVIEMINKVGAGLAEDEKFKDKIIDAPKCLGLDNLGDSAVVFKIVGDTTPGDQWEVSRELRRRLKIESDRKGINIPFPQITLNYKESKRD